MEGKGQQNPEGQSNVKDACTAAALSLQGPGEGMWRSGFREHSSGV